MRQTIVNTAVSYLGCKESDGSHRKIIDIYNSHKPLARGYAVTYTDPWCAAFVSAMAIKCGLTHIIPVECGCGEMIKLFKKLGSWEENDAYKPEPGDIIFYDWQDSGKGDNTGGSDHVGIVEKVVGSTITIIEGNYSNSVKRRTLQVNGVTIRGYGVPKYKTGSGSNTGNTGSNTGTAKPTGSQLTVDGRWGKATTTRLQIIFGTPVDGIVSNQWKSYKAENPGLVGGWDWKDKPNGKGSQLIKALQKWAGMAAKDQDGTIGPKTIKALQTKLGTPVDGCVSNPSQMVRALQNWANAQ